MKLLSLFILIGFAFAQDLPCATLLDNLPVASLQGVSTLNATLTIRYVENGGDEVRYVLVKDIENERTYHSFSEKIGEDFVTSAVYRYQHGVGTLTRGDKTEEAPSEDSIEGIEEIMELLEFDLRSYKNSEILSCDGEQTWGGLFTGQSVTLAAFNLTPEGSIQIFFDEAGTLLGVQIEDKEYRENSLVATDAFLRLEDFKVEAGLLQHGVLKEYEMQEGKAVLLEERWLEVQYNQSVDESLFKLGE